MLSTSPWWHSKNRSPMRGKGATDVSEAAATTPNVMPVFKEPAVEPTEKPKAPVTETVADSAANAPAGGDLTEAERAELKRLRDVHRDEQKFRREATENHKDAEAYRNLLQTLGVNGSEKKDFDAQASIAELKNQFESERVARLKSEVARTEGIEPEDFTGSTEDEMRASAKRFKDRIESEIAKRAQTVAPAAAPAGVVTSSSKVEGVKQITSQEQLKSMSRQERMKAHKEGLLDDLMQGKTDT